MSYMITAVVDTKGWNVEKEEVRVYGLTVIFVWIILCMDRRFVYRDVQICLKKKT